ncbi:MAG: hypothetical protein J5486_09000 [Bacteroidaceae bacterium]|nr:hypothetical protein [Bacteroidaceae bacterium]
MKKYLFMMVALVVATMSYAQNTLVATLTHEDTTIIYYYGINAFNSAHNAAVSGDIITLSGGAFTGDFTITKAITVRGTGIDNSNPTSISSTLKINIPENDTIRFSVEGVRFNDMTVLYGSFSNPCFIKCQFNSIIFDNSSSQYSNIKDALFVNCKVTSYLSLRGTTTALFSHCFVTDYYSNDSAQAQFCNCVLYGFIGNYSRSSFVNSIMCYKGNTTCYFPPETIAMNCVSICYSPSSYTASDYSYRYNMYDKMQGQQVSCAASTFEAVFNDFGVSPRSADDYFVDSQTFELTEEASTNFLGTDGTEVGLYGGQYPYNSTPDYPRITKFNVAKQATADNKLSVEIEVSAVE